MPTILTKNCSWCVMYTFSEESIHIIHGSHFLEIDLSVIISRCFTWGFLHFPRYIDVPIFVVFITLLETGDTSFRLPSLFFFHDSMLRFSDPAMIVQSHFVFVGFILLIAFSIMNVFDRPRCRRLTQLFTVICSSLPDERNCPIICNTTG